MFDYLVAHALKNIWCTPDQDHQAIVRPARLTAPGGAWNKVKVLWRTHDLPVAGVRFHVYQIGQLNPHLMGLFSTNNQWVTLAEACNEKKLIVDIYADSGVQMPRFESWFLVTPDDNLILAIKEQPLIPIDLGTEDIYFRVYSNAYFNSIRASSTPSNNYVRVEGKVCLTTEEILAFQARYNLAVALPGITYCFVNGYRVNVIDLITVSTGDVAEFVYDSSITEVVDLLVDDLQTFTSTLDSKIKYLLHYATENVPEINYQDDLDFYILKPGTGGRFSGVYYHRNQADAIRMVTHRDYAMPVAYLNGFADSQEGWDNPLELKIRIHVRNSGYLRELTNENNRINELYKLTDTQVINAMIGIDSTVPQWRAEVLEASNYTKIMRSDITEVTKAMVESAYGYNAISKLIGDTPSITRLSSGNQVVDLPIGLHNRSTAYEYDADGLLLGFYNHTYNSIYTSTSNNSRLVEVISGKGGTLLDEVYGEVEVDVYPSFEYRMYTCPIVGGLPNNQWTDVTGTNIYSNINGKVTWLSDPDETYTLVRGDRNFLAYDLQIPMQSGVLRFTLTHQQQRGNTLQNYTMQIPMGELDVFLNGHSLVENVDYIVNFPEIIIISKKYLVNPGNTNQNIHVRSTGFCNPDFTREIVTDTGFVKNGVLSNNNKYDIRDDKVLRIVVGGATWHREELKFAETHTGVIVPGVDNGQPYMIRDVLLPMQGLTIQTARVLREASQVIDENIRDYLTPLLPEPDHSDLSVIPELYQVYSPFCSAIIHDLATGILDDPKMHVFYNDNDVLTICAQYENLLDFDPTTEGHRLNTDYVIVHPHDLDTAIQLNLVQYKFLKRVVKIYLNDAVELSPFIQLN